MQITYLGIVARVTEEGLMETARMIQIELWYPCYMIYLRALSYTRMRLCMTPVES